MNQEKNWEDVSQLLGDVRQGKITSVYLLYGDEFLCKSVFRPLLDALVPTSNQGLNYEALDGGTTSVEEIAGRIRTFPLIPGSKVVAVHGTRIFYSQKSTADLLKKAKNAFEKQDVKKAAGYLADALSAAGLSFDDVRGENFKGAKTGMLVGDFLDANGEQGAWFNEVLAYCLESKAPVSTRENEDQVLNEILSSGIPQGNHLILIAEAVDKRKALYKTIKKIGVIVDCTLADGSSAADKRRQQTFFRARMNEVLGRAGKTTGHGVFEALYEKVGPDVRMFDTEIEKLVSFAGERKEVLPEDVQEATRKTKQDPIYEMTNALGEKDAEKTLAVMDGLLESGLFPLQIVSAVANQIRKLLLAKDLVGRHTDRQWKRGMAYGTFQSFVLPALQREKENPLPAGAHPFVLYKTLSQADKYSLHELLRALDSCLWADEQLKTTPRSPKLILERIVLEICGVLNEPMSQGLKVG
jgi:DNA polymerase-3 subunit delta